MEPRRRGARHRRDGPGHRLLPRHRAADGRPHAAGIGVAYHDGDLWSTSRPDTRKSRYLAANPACTISIRLEGIDLVARARRTASPTRRSRGDRRGLPRRRMAAQADGDVITAPYSAQSAGPPPWHVYRLRLETVFGVGLREPYGASRWRF